MKLYHLIIILFIAALAGSCSGRKCIYIIADDNEDIVEAANELASYLTETYPEESFIVTCEDLKGPGNILLKLTEDNINNSDEAYRVSCDKGRIMIYGKTPRALFNGVHGLLKEIGWNFYLSFDVPPSNPGHLNFTTLEIENKPLKEKRIIFNWHNFLSGCSGWDLEQWNNWIDGASRIGFNTIMVHAYGNNPMQSFELNGKQKEAGYLSTTLKGRDWGTQHVNDVRLLRGGYIYKDYEFGSEASKVPDAERIATATSLMQKVFEYASVKSMDVCFAVDVDTWMANPQNIINTVPDEALLPVAGYNTVNPSHPEGRKYYEALLKKLFSDYPAITHLSMWSRFPAKRPHPLSIWLGHTSNTLSPEWRKEYFTFLEEHPAIKDEYPNPGLFAISKLVKSFREILDNIAPEVELSYGSWSLEFPPLADPFMPGYCGLIGLDYDYAFDKPEIIEQLAEVGKNRNLYPVVWAHHDDHRYIGRPYRPFENFNHLLSRSKSNGYGIIHWTTHPLDLLFSNYENQVWQNTENETLNETSEKYALSFMTGYDESLATYFKEWFNKAPMFGRETSDYFLRPDKDYHLEGYSSSSEVVDEAKIRLVILNKVDTLCLNSKGLREYHYHEGMEEFIISFFNNHSNIHRAFKLLEEGRTEGAIPLIRALSPEETLDIFAATISEYGPTRGEEGVLISLNLRWLIDYIDIRQRAGLEPVRINFQPTSHDPLSQGPGTYTFFIDRNKYFWLGEGEEELGTRTSTNGKIPLEDVDDSWIEISKATVIELETMRKHKLPAKNFKIELFPATGSDGCKIELLEEGKIIISGTINNFTNTWSIPFTTGGGNIEMKIIPQKGIVKIAGLAIKPF